MRKKQIFVDGALVSVYSLPSNSFDREEVCRELSEGELAVILYPEREADYGVLSFDKNNNEPREPYLSFAALSYLFERKLGFPKMMLDVKWRGKTVELPIEYGGYNFSVNIGKCKILCTKTVKFADGIEMRARVIGTDNTMAVMVCHDSELFDEGKIRLLLSLFLDEGVRIAIAVSAADEFKIKSVANPLFYEAITAGVAALSAEGIRLHVGRNVCEIDGREHNFSVDNGILTFHPEINLIG